MYLTKLTGNAIKAYRIENKKVKISGIACDSRDVKKGMLFAVIKGNKENGNKYINEAIQAGAIAILCKKNDVKFLSKKVSNILLTENVRIAVVK